MMRAAILLLLGASAGAWAQPVKIEGSIRSRVESWDWFGPEDPYTFSGNLLRVSVSQQREQWDWQLEFAAPILLGLPAGRSGHGGSYFTANDGSQHAGMVFLKQGFLRRKWGNGRSLRFGRFDYSDGAELVPKNGTLAALKRDRINMRLIGPFSFTHVQRAFDGVQLSTPLQGGNVTILGVIPTRGVFQADAWGHVNTALGYAAWTRPWGSGKHAAETRIFGLQYHDWRDVLKTDNRAIAARRAESGADIRVFTYGGHSVHAVETRSGTVDGLIWAAGQAGRWGQLTHRAYAYSLEAGWQPKGVTWKPWIRGGFADGSGDGDPNDNRHETFFQVLPTPRPFAKFPFFNMMNNRDRFGILILRPHAKLTVTAEFHALRLSNRRDLWYFGGGAYQPWSFGYVGRSAGGAASLADLYDAGVEYRIHPRFTLGGYFGYADARAAISGASPNGRFHFVEGTWRF